MGQSPIFKAAMYIFFGLIIIAVVATTVMLFML